MEAWSLIVHFDLNTALSGLLLRATKSGASIHAHRSAIVTLAGLDILVSALLRVTSADSGLADSLSHFDWVPVTNFMPAVDAPLSFTPSAAYVARLNLILGSFDQ